jgi:putative membrane protein
MSPSRPRVTVRQLPGWAVVATALFVAGCGKSDPGQQTTAAPTGADGSAGSSAGQGTAPTAPPVANDGPAASSTPGGSADRSGADERGVDAGASGSSGNVGMPEDSSRGGMAETDLPRSADDRGPAQGPAGRSAASMAAATQAPSQVDEADKRFIVAAALDGLFELQVSQLAAARAATSEVKALAMLLVNDHTNANAELAQLATVRGIPLPTQLPQNLQAQLRRLGQANGPRFDRDYLRRVGIGEHEKAIRTFEQAARETDDAQLKAWIEKNLPVLRQHLSEAEKLVKRG